MDSRAFAVTKFEAGLDGVTFMSGGERLLGGFYRAAGDSRRPTAVLLHGLPGIEKHLDVAYALRDRGWNCLYFHFRGSWGSRGDFSLDGMTDDTRAAVDWVLAQPSVDRERLAIIGASTGSYPALVHAAADARVKAVVGVSPVILPEAFTFPVEMARAFSEMLTGVTGEELVRQWETLQPLTDPIRALAPRPLLVIAAEEDDIFPPSQYEARLHGLEHVDVVRRDGTDHGFSNSRRWLVTTATDWLIAKLGA